MAVPFRVFRVFRGGYAFELFDLRVVSSVCPGMRLPGWPVKEFEVARTIGGTTHQWAPTAEPGHA